MIAIYARVSTEEQAKHGFSLNDQIREGRRKAEALSGELVEYVDEGVSGELLDRPALSKLRQDLHRGLIDTVICLDPDRLSRKLMNQLILSDEIESRANLMFVNGDYAHTPEGQLFYQMRGAISQFEKAKINERMSRGRREKARQGRVLRDFHIYGYDYQQTTGQFVVNPREASVVQLIFNLFTKPPADVQGISGIANYLNRRGILAKRGGPFHRQVVRQMLMNRAYIGEFYQNKWNTEGMFANKYKKPDERVRQKKRPKEEWIKLPIPAIITDEQFYHASRLLEQARRRFAGISRHVYILSGLLVCGDCGNTLMGRKVRNWGKEVYVYTDRKSGSAVRTENLGCGTVLPCTTLDDIVWDEVINWVGLKTMNGTELKATNGTADEAVLWEDLESSRHEIEEQIQRINHDLQRTQLATERLLSFLYDPDLDSEAVRRKLKEFKVQYQKLLDQKTTLELDLKTSHAATSEERRRTMEQIWRRLRAPDEAINPEHKRQLVRTVVKNIYISNGGEAVDIYTF